MQTSYDRERATRLVPLLKSITRELRERARKVAGLRSELAGLKPEDRSNTYFDLQAALATQLRELRLTSRELDQLGCSLDPAHPLRVLIPGNDGNSAFAWRYGKKAVEPLVADNVA